ncbi:glutamate racemase [Candidatus Steffania adelgidicola]|uniref:glutamate racemase n=1 Tax=Candidatus Steffania adelgidicola TaxID=1076626 RepID=UPI001D0058EF|nr:glutamate racemase [Candidatus Steffania adelgidicola]UDG79931.1 Glutamate racemase [Candidatus Steffania adelgidicola]
MVTKIEDKASIFLKPVVSKGIVVPQPRILILDSGVGGLSIYDKVKQTLPNARYLYVFDNEGFPYGEKSEKFIVDRVVGIIGSMWCLHQFDLVIIACNTASTIVLPVLRKRFSFPIIGVVPAIKPAIKLTRNGIVGLLATRATIQCRYTYDLINQFAGDCQILQLGMPELVHMAEAKLHGEIVLLLGLRKLLNPWLNSSATPDTIVLGCTHFSLLRQELHAVFPKGTYLVDSGAAVARRAAWLSARNMKVNDYLENQITQNTAYCLARTPQVQALVPALMCYGFASLQNLSCIIR